MKSNKRLKSSLGVFSSKKENKEEIFSGELGIPISGRKIVSVPNRSGYVYVRLLTNKSELIQARNTSVPLLYGLAVKIKRVKNTYTIIGKDYERYSNNAGSSTSSVVVPMPNHGGQHSLNPDSNMGSDTVWVYSRQFMPFLSFPSGTSLELATSPYFYQYNNQWIYPQQTGTPSLASYLPTATGSAKMVLYWIDARDNSYQITAGNAFSSSITDPSQIAQYIPTSPDGYSIPLMAVRLETGTSSLSWDNLYDVRPFLHVTATGSSGAGLIYAQDEGSPLGTVSTFNFVGDNVSASVSGTVVRVFVTGSAGGVASSLEIQNHGNVVTGSKLSFDGNVNVTVSGSIISANFPITTYFRVAQPIFLSSETGTYWKVPDGVFASGSLAVFRNGHALIPEIDYTADWYVSGTYRYFSAPATGTYHLVHYGVPCYAQVQLVTGSISTGLLDSQGNQITDSNGTGMVDSNG